MSSQAESLQQLMAFFAVSDQVVARPRIPALHAAPSPAHAGAVAQAPARPAKAALPPKATFSGEKKANGVPAAPRGEGGFKKF
jgi:hypothetical protein